MQQILVHFTPLLVLRIDLCCGFTNGQIEFIPDSEKEIRPEFAEGLSTPAVCRIPTETRCPTCLNSPSKSGSYPYG